MARHNSINDNETHTLCTERTREGVNDLVGEVPVGVEESSETWERDSSSLLVTAGGEFSGDLSIHVRGENKSFSLTAGDGLLSLGFRAEGDFSQSEGERGIVHQALITRVHPHTLLQILCDGPHP